MVIDEEMIDNDGTLDTTEAFNERYAVTPPAGDDIHDTAEVGNPPSEEVADRSSADRHDERSLSSCAASCRSIREDLRSLRAQIVTSTSEQTKWIHKMNRLVKKVVPALVYAATSNGTLDDEERQWLQLAVQQRRDGAGSASRSASMSGSPHEEGIGQLVVGTTPSLSTWTTLESTSSATVTTTTAGSSLARAAKTSASSSIGARDGPVVAPSAGTQPGSSQRTIASATSSHHSLNLAPIAIAPNHLGDAAAAAAVLALAASSPTKAPNAPRGTNAYPPALAAMESHISRLEMHRRIQTEHEEQRGGLCLSGSGQEAAMPLGVGNSTRRTPGQALHHRNGHGVLTMTCYGAASNDHGGGLSPKRSLAPQHPWAMGTSARHAALLEEADLAAALNVTSLQLRNASPSRVDSMLAHHQTAMQPSRSAVVSCSDAVSPSEGSAVGGGDGVQTVTPFTSYCQQHARAVPGASHARGLPHAMGTTVLRSSGTSSSPIPPMPPSSRGVVVTAATSPPLCVGIAPTNTAAGTTLPTSSHVMGLDMAAALPPNRRLVSSQSARIKRGLTMAAAPVDHPVAQPTSARAGGGGVVRHHICVRGGGVVCSNTTQQSTGGADHSVSSTGGEQPDERSGSAVGGVTAWTPPASGGIVRNLKRPA